MEGTYICGIAGYVCTGEFEPRLNTALPLLGTFMTDRGRQSWGWTNGTDIYKNLGAVRSTFSAELLGHKSAMIHTRHSTTGAITAENSHPFSIKGIIGVHNGMIHNHWSIGKKYPERNAAVDSEHIFHHIADGIPLSELEGYGAVVFWRDGLLYLGRFNGGELSLAKTDFGWVYASTKDAVEDALHMSGLGNTIKFYVKLKEGILYQLAGDQIVRAETRLSISKSTSTATWQGGYTGGNKYIQKGFWHQNKWYKDADDWLKAHPQAALPANAPKLDALPASTETKTAKEEQEAWYEGFADDFPNDTEDAYFEEKWKKAVGKLTAQTAGEEIVLEQCDYCGLVKSVVMYGRSLICDDCYGESEDDIIAAQEDALRLAAGLLDDPDDGYELAYDWELSDAATLEPLVQECYCGLCNDTMHGDTPVYFCKDDPEDRICRFCFQDEFGTAEENNTPAELTVQ